MDLVTDLTRSILHIRVDLWMVIAAALLLAFVDRAVHIRVAPRYDAWWLFNVPAAAEKKLMRELSPRGRGRPRREAGVAEARPPRPEAKAAGQVAPPAQSA